MSTFRTVFLATTLGAAVGAGGEYAFGTQSKADLYPPVAREHVKSVCLEQRSDVDPVTGQPIYVWTTRASYSVPALVDGLRREEWDYLALTYPEVLPTVGAMLDGLVTPLAAQQAGLRSATELMPR